MARLVLKAAGSAGVPVRNGLIAEYRYNEGGGTILHDYSGKGWNATLPAAPNAPVWGTTGATFDTTDYISPSHLFSGLTSCTIVAVVNYNASAAIKPIMIARRVGVANPMFAVIRIGSDNKLWGYSKDDAGTTNTVSSSGTKTGSWKMLTLTRNTSGHLEIFDGITSQDTESGSIIGVTTTDLTMMGGDSVIPTYGNGTIGYILVYNRVITSSELSKIFTFMKTKMAGRGVTLS